MRCLACNKILSDYEATRGIFKQGKKMYLDMCVQCDATPPEEVEDNLELLDGEFDNLVNEDSFLEEEDLGIDIYDEVKV